MSETVPEPVARLLASVGEAAVGGRRVHGGMINEAWQVDLRGGDRVFAKLHRSPPPGMFAAEAAGLRWLRSALPGVPRAADARQRHALHAEGAVGVPEVVAVAEDGLVLEWVAPAARPAGGAEALGRGLALLHSAGATGYAGPPGPDGAPLTEGFLGDVAVPQQASPTWAAFLAEQRLRPLAARADGSGRLPAGTRARVDRVCERLHDGDLTGPPEPPARLHGDLWSGNVLWGADGRPWLVDPASLGGHREADVSMLLLFGGVDDRWLGAYEEVAPLADGWRERIDLEQLTPLLVHAILFGGSYGAAVDAAARRYC